MKLEKITSSVPRRYDDACGTAHALDLIGERWALLVMRELMMGPRRFNDLRTSLPGISANVLTQRLEGLERAGLLLRRRLPPPASVQVYELTEWGLEAEPILLHLGMWAARSPAHDPTRPFSAVSMMLSLRAKASNLKGTADDVAIGFQFGPELFHALICDAVLTTHRGEVASANVRVTGSPTAVAALVYGKVPLETVEAEGGLTVEGDRAALVKFAALFELPPKAA